MERREGREDVGGCVDRVAGEREAVSVKHRVDNQSSSVQTRCSICVTCRTSTPECLSVLDSASPHYPITVMPQTLGVQTSVAVSSPSKAKSVCSLSVCLVKRTESIPSGKREKKREKPNLSSFFFF